MRCVEFQDLFPDRCLSRADHVTVITLSQRTQNDMSSWNEDVEQERENLLHNVRMSQLGTDASLAFLDFVFVYLLIFSFWCPVD